MQRILRPLFSYCFVICCLSLSACDRGRRHSAQDGTAQSGGKPFLSAEPNPVPAGDPNQPLGSTVITWSTGSASIGDLYVKVNRSDEVGVTSGPSGTIKIDWIAFDSNYEFRLYGGRKRTTLLAKLDVTRDN